MSKKSFFLLAFIMFLSMTGYGIVLPALPYLADSLSLNSFQMGTLITGWAMSQFVIVPFWGKLIDRTGRKPVLVFGLFGFGMAFLLMIFARSYAQLLIIRIIGAAVSSGTQPAVYAIISDVYSKSERGPALAKMGAANTLGFLLGPVVGSLFTPLGINAPFVAAAILSFITLPFAYLYLKEPEHSVPVKKRVSFNESWGLLFQSGYRELYLVVLGRGVSASAFFSMLGYFMIARFASSATETGFAFSTQSFAAVIVQVFIIGLLYRRMSELGIEKSGMIVEIIGYLCVAFSPSVWVTFLGCALIGSGHALTIPTLISLLSKRGLAGQGMVMGLQQSMDSLGRSIGPLVGGWLFMLSSSGAFIGSALINVVLIFLLFIQQGAIIPEQAKAEKAGREISFK